MRKQSALSSGARRIRGQGMTEYIIIVALIAIAAIGVVSAFGDVVTGQFGIMGAKLGGGEAATAQTLVETAAGEANTKATAKTLADYGAE